MEDLFPDTLGTPAPLELGESALAPAPALELEAPTSSPLDGLELVYCTTADEAARLVEEMRQDAAGWPLGLDIETTPLPAEAERLQALLLRQAALKGELRAARKAKAPAPSSRPWKRRGSF